MGMSTSWGRTISYPHLAPDWAAVMRLPASVSASMTTRPGPQRASSPMTSRRALRLLSGSTARGSVPASSLVGKVLVMSREAVRGESYLGRLRQVGTPQMLPASGSRLRGHFGPEEMDDH